MIGEEQMTSAPSDEPAFIEGLDLDRLNPPDIKQFIQALPRRLDQLIGGLNDRAPAEPLVQQLNSLVDQLDRLIDEVGAAGFSPDRSLELSLADWSAHGNRAPELVDVRLRLETGASEAARRIAGIPPEGWRTSPELLREARSWVGRVSSSLRRIESRVESANAAPASPG